MTGSPLRCLASRTGASTTQVILFLFIELSVRGNRLVQFSQVMLRLYFSLNRSVMFQFYVSVMFQLCSSLSVSDS